MTTLEQHIWHYDERPSEEVQQAIVQYLADSLASELGSDIDVLSFDFFEGAFRAVFSAIPTDSTEPRFEWRAILGAEGAGPEDEIHVSAVVFCFVAGRRVNAPARVPGQRNGDFLFIKYEQADPDSGRWTRPRWLDDTYGEWESVSVPEDVC